VHELGRDLGRLFDAFEADLVVGESTPSFVKNVSEYRFTLKYGCDRRRQSIHGRTRKSELLPV
jgi:hypothetical protein